PQKSPPPSVGVCGSQAPTPRVRARGRRTSPRRPTPALRTPSRGRAPPNMSPRRPLRPLLPGRTENLDRIAYRAPRTADPLIEVAPQRVPRRESPLRRRHADEPGGGDGPVRRGRDRPAQRLWCGPLSDPIPQLQSTCRALRDTPFTVTPRH